MLFPKVVRCMPSTITLMSLSLGLWSLRFTINGQIMFAIICILICIILDGMDGKLARYLKTANNFGATLDTLADFTSFGISPAFLLYSISSHKSPFLWISTIIFVICMALRLARFTANPPNNVAFFIGVPAPAGALLVLTPIILHTQNIHTPTSTHLALTLLTIGMLLISKIPTIAFNKIKIPTQWMPTFSIATVLAISFLFMFPWEGLITINILYLLTFPFSWVFYKKQ